MGACSSTEAAPAHGPVKKKVDDTEIGKAYEQAGDELEAYINKREGFSKFLAVADTVPAEEQLLVSTIAMVIFSAELPTFRPWVEQKAGNANALSCSMSPSNVNFSSWMLRGMFAWSREIAEGKQPETDEAVSKSQLMSVLRLKLLWEKLLETSAVYSFTHPHLGKLALVQPLLMQAILHRGAGRGNGQGDQPDPVVGYFLDNGADVDAPNCLGITPLMLTIGALHTTLSSDSGPTDDGCKQAQTVWKMLLDRGANPVLRCRTWGPGLQIFCTMALGFFEPLLCDPAKDSFDLLDVLTHAEERSDGDDRKKVFADLKWDLQFRIEEWEAHQAADPEAAALRALPKHSPTERLEVVPWSRAMYNITHAVSQVTSGKTPWDRLQILFDVQRTSTYVVPNLNLVSLERLKAYGKIPRFSSEGGDWAPTPAQQLSVNDRIVFVSHRWLSSNSPDNSQNTKYKQVVHAATQLAKLRGLAESQLFLWLDFAVIDQSNPMPSVQSLPIYISCCHEFLYIWHPQYFERAWCLTEAFMFWKLSGSSKGGPFRKMCFDRAGALIEQDITQRPPDPALGKLAFEAERVALSTMTAIMPYRDS